MSMFIPSPLNPAHLSGDLNNVRCNCGNPTPPPPNKWGWYICCFLISKSQTFVEKSMLAAVTESDSITFPRAACGKYVYKPLPQMTTHEGCPILRPSQNASIPLINGMFWRVGVGIVPISVSWIATRHASSILIRYSHLWLRFRRKAE